MHNVGHAKRLSSKSNKRNAQSAMEYLMTYGWAILIISIVLASLWTLGLFSGRPGGGSGASCVGTVGYLCGTPVLASNGLLLTSIGQTVSGSALTVTGLGCSNTSTVPSTFSSTSFTLPPSQSASVAFNCNLPSSVVGSSFTGTLWIQYALGTTTGLISKIGAVQTQIISSSSTGSSGSSPTYAPTSAWTSQSNTLQVQEYKESCVTANNYIYCLGGIGTGIYSLVQYASIPGTGGPTTTWYSQPPSNQLAVGVYTLSCVTANNYIYCMGGTGSTSTVQYASILGSGVTSAWYSQPTNTLAVGEEYHSCVTANNYIYCLGGIEGTSVVQYASILGNGGTSAWYSQSTNTLAVGVFLQSCVTAHNYIYCLGGDGTGSIVQYASILGSGVTSAWYSQSANVLAISDYGQSCVTANNYLYCMGGDGPYSSVQYASIPSSGGPTGTWTSQSALSPANTLAIGVDDQSCVTANNYLYCMGGWTGSASVTNVQYALT